MAQIDHQFGGMHGEGQAQQQQTAAQQKFHDGSRKVSSALRIAGRPMVAPMCAIANVFVRPSDCRMLSAS